jgi:hypothetical protein
MASTHSTYSTNPAWVGPFATGGSITPEPVTVNIKTGEKVQTAGQAAGNIFAGMVLKDAPTEAGAESGEGSVEPVDDGGGEGAEVAATEASVAPGSSPSVEDGVDLDALEERARQAADGRLADKRNALPAVMDALIPPGEAESRSVSEIEAETLDLVTKNKINEVNRRFDATGRRVEVEALAHRIDEAINR